MIELENKNQERISTSKLSATAGTTGQFIQKVFDLMILFFGAKAVMNVNFTVGQLVAFRMLSGSVSGSVLRACLVSRRVRIF